MTRLHTYSISLTWLAFCCGCLLIVGCQSRQQATQEHRPIITVTIEPQRYFAEAIAGDKFRIETMVPKGVSPESYDPTPQQLVALSQSVAYLRIGHIGFELNWMERLLDNVPQLRVFDLSEGIELIEGSCYHAPNETDDPTHHHDHDHGVDPHLWNSTTNGLLLARNTCKALVALDTLHAAYFQARCDSLCQRIEATDRTVRQILSAPEADRTFMMYHPALSYFARDYGLEQLVIEEQGKEPSPAHLKNLINQSKEKGVRIIFIQPEFDRRNAETIGKQTGAQVVSIQPLNPDWETELIQTARALVHPPIEPQ